MMGTAAGATAALPGAGSGIRATDAFLPTLPGFVDIARCQAHNQTNNGKDNQTIHLKHTFLLRYRFFSARSVSVSLLVFPMRYPIVPTNTATAIRPDRKPAPKLPVVISVPI